LYNEDLLPVAAVLLGGILPIACAWCAGRRLIPPSFPHTIALAAGAVLLAQAIFLLLLAGWLSLWSLAALGLACLACFQRTPFERPRKAWLLFLPFFLFYLVHAMAPETQPDGYTYHLGLVAEWLRIGGLADRVGFYEMLPQGVEALFTMAFAIGGHPAAKLVHFAFTLAAAPLIVATARKLGFDGMPAAGLFLLSPVVGVCGTSAYNDVALAFFTLAAFYVLVDGRSAALAGLLAGFCYAVKLPGILIAPALVAWLLVACKWRAALTAAAAAAAVMAPWLARTWWMSGNPVAPLFNRWFPNSHFHLSSHEFLTGWLRTYDVPWQEQWWEVTLSGARTGGALGLAFLLAPVALLALRRREGRWLWLATAVAALPWMFNAGTRFLIPAAVFAALALAMTLPRPLAWTLVAVQAIAGLPPVQDYFGSPGWRLHGVPWRAALRWEHEQDYLRRTLPEYRRAEMLNRHVKPGERVLELVAAPWAYTHATLITPWQNSYAELVLDTLMGASETYAEPLYVQESKWEPVPLQSVRIRNALTAPPDWSIQEVELPGGVKPAGAVSTPNPWEIRLALDGNAATRWRTWQPRQEGMAVTMELSQPAVLSGIRFLCRQPGPMRIDILPAGGQWREIGEPEQRADEPRNLRPLALRFLREQGFRYVLTDTNGEGYGSLGQELRRHAPEWGLEELANVGSVCLLRVRDP